MTLLEVVLFLTGRYLLWSRRAVRHGRDNTIQIVAVGDSHTFGVGTSKKYSYPMQLEKLLNYNNNSPRFSVINLGIPGASTKSQIDELENFLSKNSTQIVFLLTGRNNDFELMKQENISLFKEVAHKIFNLRSIRFLRKIFNYTVGSGTEHADDILNKDKIYNDYMNFYLSKAKRLCDDRGARLVLLSYYNSSSNVVKIFSHKNNIPYFDFTENFEWLFASNEKTKYFSPDMSHMNHLGYKFFAEQLYDYLFLNQANLNLKIGPLIKKINDESFYADEKEIKQIIESQKIRIKSRVNKKGLPSEDYPYELIHLGHIYMEIGDIKSAKKFYIKGLLSSNYANNNTIIAPIINCYLRNEGKEGALKISEEILLHNPQNSIAKYYYERLKLGQVEL